MQFFHQLIGSWFVQIMACHLFITKPFHKTMQADQQLEYLAGNLSKNLIKVLNFLWGKNTWWCDLENINHFGQALVYLCLFVCIELHTNMHSTPVRMWHTGFLSWKYVYSMNWLIEMCITWLLAKLKSHIYWQRCWSCIYIYAFTACTFTLYVNIAYHSIVLTTVYIYN